MKMRTQWFVRHPIQTRYLLTVMVSILAPVLVVGGCLYYLVFELLARQIAFPEAVFSNLVPVIHRVNAVLLVAVPVLVLLIFTWAVWISHRMAGPIERLEGELGAILADPAKPAKIQVRRGDDLKDLVEGINTVLERCCPKI
ncbi:MAG: hypothetical protein HY592_00910 [Candidatus Omnitrophica bacterium]|nr:hypothetical protein [Candidatus Omnitrophota bacterium]